MIAKRLIVFAAALGAILGCAGVLVVALSFALYALFKDWVGPAGASALTALVVALVMGGAAVFLLGQAKGKKPKVDKHAKDHASTGVVDRALDMARERPLLAAGAALAAGLLALRNPALIGAVVGAASARANRDR